MRRPIAVGIVGAGKQGRNHALRFWRSPFRVTHYFDPSPNASLENTLEIQRVSSLKELLSPELGIDVVIVSTPPAEHRYTALCALQAGKHVVVEKPTALSLSETNELISNARQHKGVLGTFFSRRWDPDFLAVREVLAQGVLGDVHHLESKVTDAYDGSSTYSGRSAWKLHKPGGGLLLDWAPHLFDQLFELFQNQCPNTVACHMARPNQIVDKGLAEQFFISVEYARKHVFLSASWNATLPPPRWYAVGKAGAMRLEPGAQVSTVRYWQDEGIRDITLPLPRLVENGFARYYLEMLDNIELRQREEHRMRQVAYAIELASRSARDRTKLSWNKLQEASS